VSSASSPAPTSPRCHRSRLEWRVHSYRAAALEVARYVGGPSPSSSPAIAARPRTPRLIEVDYEPMEPVLCPFVAESPGLVASDRSFHYGDRTRPSPPPNSSSRASTSPAGPLGRVLWRRRRLGPGIRDPHHPGELQGPFTLHSVAAASSDSQAGSPDPPPNSGGASASSRRCTSTSPHRPRRAQARVPSAGSRIQVGTWPAARGDSSAQRQAAFSGEESCSRATTS
jgi:hypothetical protein